MEQQDIDRIVQLVGYLTFFVVYLTFNKVGKLMLRKDPDNLLLPLYFMKRVKPSWKAIYLTIGAICFLLMLSFTPVLPPYAAFISIAVSIYGGSIMARWLKKEVWVDDKKPSYDDSK